LLANRGLTLALVDGITGGDVGDRLRDTPHADVLISEKRPEDCLKGEAAEQLRDVTETAATQVRSETGASLGLAVLGLTRRPEAPTGIHTLAYLSLSDGTQVITRSFHFGNEEDLMRRWLSTRALDLVRRYLIGALDEDEAIYRRER
jgi:hypothetical protein